MASQLQTSDASEGNEAPSGVPPASRPAPAERSRRAHLSLRASAHLDWIRGLAAAAVMLSHVRGLFFLDYPELSRKSPALSALYALTGLGHQAVMVFFVSSGFFISTSVVFALRERRWFFGGLFDQPSIAAGTGFASASLLGALWDQIGLLTAFRLRAGSLRPVQVLPSQRGASLDCFRFLRESLLPAEHSLPGFWLQRTSLEPLSYEFWYYLLFPALVVAIFSRGPALGRVANIILAAAVAVFVGPQICLYFLIWLAVALPSLFSPARSSAPHSETVLAHCHLNERAFCGHARS